MRKAYFLEGLYNTGPEKARVLLEHFGTVSRVMEALRSTELVVTPSGTAKLPRETPFAKIKGFGPKWVQKNKLLLEK
ncbi:MAG: hypothetical protein ACTSU5_18890 [Promethearchaeota archaeon]